MQFLLMAALLPLSCAMDAEEPSTASAAGQSEPIAATATAEAAEAGGALNLAAPATVTERKLIRTGSLAIEVEVFATAVTAVRQIAITQSGFVADSRAHKDSRGKMSGSLTLRIPAERFDATLAEVAKVGEVERSEMSTEDVTRAYADLETRLAVKRQTAARLRAILEHNAGNVQQILEVEREISRVVEELESMEGQRRYYDAQVALSTLTVELFEPSATIRAGATGPLRRALRDALEVLSTSVAAIIYVVVAVAPWAAIAAMVIWIVKRRRRKQSS